MADPSPQELLAEHKLLQIDPARYVAIKSEAIAKYPNDSQAFFGRHQGWLRLGDLDPGEWPNHWGPLYQADCHSRLGNEGEAIAACARLKDDHWTPGLDGTPAGNKREAIAEIRRRLAGLQAAG